ncbi:MULTISPECIES: lipopolysaccharide transport periplasmic protein LptA [unclassified Chromobacterium]|uniref:lipopolysaccharide transport periplasmic protein LptA n=1 Tax=unclassified Chromobacterium TaxID=2641838 RepID=UPI000D2F87F1|nr:MULTISPECIES: lipopolysaccharide transport periplasmic protein LptA [unclassified Chromobacterium]MCP1289470.1 lipopolysaccharide transport periplasmic protein LptA [Chromobacterium sp. S0633]PTU64025.1 lipopolysaccharide transport periplasmic protein LptA [Chromobacterium sp. Panama]UJB31930.1 lipopolysaccharide transport periplasmic protein LptA [Chromobacterium sp. Beijing]
MKNKLRLLLAGLALAAASVAHAEQADRTKPMEITSDNGCTMDQIKGVSTCEGNVVIIQGTLRLNADKVVATQDKQGNQTLVATGRIVTFRQKMDGKNEWVEGQSSRLDYSSAANLAVLTGNARVKREGDLVVGNVITYNTQNETYQVTGGTATGPNKGRVTVILQPKNTASQPATAKPASGAAK